MPGWRAYPFVDISLDSLLTESRMNTSPAGAVDCSIGA